MHKQYPSSKKYAQWWKHLRPYNKKKLHRSTRAKIKQTLHGKNDRIWEGMGYDVR